MFPMKRVRLLFSPARQVSWVHSVGVDGSVLTAGSCVHLHFRTLTLAFGGGRFLMSVFSALMVLTLTSY